MKIRKVLSLYNGISACHLALEKANIDVDQVYYAEIDKHANFITKKNYPEDILLGNVLDWESWDIAWNEIDLVVAGFPCQSWSTAGHQLGDKDPRGMLFWTTLDIIAKVLESNKNAKYLMENVKMKSDFEKYITYHTIDRLGYCEKILINSSSIVPQNRERYYWSNFKISQPHKKNLKLRDINKNIIDLDLTFEEIKKMIIDKEIIYNKKMSESQSLYRSYKNIRKGSEVAKTLTASSYKGMQTNGSTNIIENINGKLIFRQLNEAECELIQSFPELWTDGISKTQRIKCLGNAWTVDIISHIFKCMFEDYICIESLIMEN